MSTSRTLTNDATLKNDAALASDFNTLATIAPVVIVAAWPFASSSAPTLSHALLVGILCVSSVTDLNSRRIPNWLTYGGCGLALVLNVVGSLLSFSSSASSTLLQETLGPIGLASALAGAGACFGLMLIVYMLAGSGAGDVKLASAIGAIVGMRIGFSVILWCHLLAGAFVILWLIATLGPLRLCRAAGHCVVPTVVQMPADRSGPTLAELFKRPVPMAVFFALGTLISMSGVTLP